MRPCPAWYHSQADLLAFKGEMLVEAVQMGGITLHPASHWPCFSPWLRQDATNIRNQYRDLLVSWEMGWAWVLRLGGPPYLDPAWGHWYYLCHLLS